VGEPAVIQALRWKAARFACARFSTKNIHRPPFRRWCGDPRHPGRSLTPILPEYDGLAVKRCWPTCGLPAPHPGPPSACSTAVDAAIHALFHAFGGCGQRFCSPPAPTFGYYSPCAQGRAWRSRRIRTWERISASPWGRSAPPCFKRAQARACCCSAIPNNPTRHSLAPS